MKCVLKFQLLFQQLFPLFFLQHSFSHLAKDVVYLDIFKMRDGLMIAVFEFFYVTKVQLT